MPQTQLARRSAAAEALVQRRGDLDAARTVASLCDGLDLLIDLFVNRIDRDVEQNFGMDSMVMPASTAGEIKASLRARSLIDVYSHVVAAEEARERNYIKDDVWFANWLTELRCEGSQDEKLKERAARYRDMPADERRLKFASSLERRLPLATNAPLVTYRLFPLGVRITVAVAFGDNFRAGEIRNQQISLLPIIADCHECHGQPLDNGERCSTCSNPLWNYAWLTAD
jgi:hypothetical protein